MVKPARWRHLRTREMRNGVNCARMILTVGRMHRHRHLREERRQRKRAVARRHPLVETKPDSLALRDEPAGGKQQASQNRGRLLRA